MSTNNQIKPYKGQVWESLRRHHNSHNLFNDPEFPAVRKSIFISRSLPDGVEWRRPRDVMRNPKFIVDGFDRTDLDQGSVGNCWFIAGCVGIMQSKECFAKVVPTDQDYDNYYCGVFHFRFWQYGEWVDVVIDDMLPFYPNGKLVFCSNKKQPNELWGPLLEKAYAKLYGGYEALDGGMTTDALIDMSGGIEESFDLTQMNSQQKQELWSKLVQAYNKGSIIGCSINPDSYSREARLSNGLVKGHAFTVTKFATVNAHGRQVTLVRCRNPWGNECEWKGAWCDSSPEWKAVSYDEKVGLDLKFEADGEFWMERRDFLENWSNVHICHISTQSFTSGNTTSTWSYTLHHGAWIPGVSAGGCGQSNMAKFWTNPQYHIRVTQVDKSQTGLATLIIALMQKDSRIKKRDTGYESTDEFIQFRLLRVKNGVYAQENTSNGLKFYSNQLDRVGSSGSYINMREVAKSFQVPPGDYVIIPTTYEEDRPAEFLLRIFTEHSISYNSLNNNRSNLTQENIQIDQIDLDKVLNKMGHVIGNYGLKFLHKAGKYVNNHLLPQVIQKGSPILHQHNPSANMLNQSPQHQNQGNISPIGFNLNQIFDNTPFGNNNNNNQPSGFNNPPYPDNFNQANNNFPQNPFLNQPPSEYNAYQHQGYNNAEPNSSNNIMQPNIQEACNLM